MQWAQGYMQTPTASLAMIFEFLIFFWNMLVIFSGNSTKVIHIDLTYFRK